MSTDENFSPITTLLQWARARYCLILKIVSVTGYVLILNHEFWDKHTFLKSNKILKICVCSKSDRNNYHSSLKSYCFEVDSFI